MLRLLIDGKILIDQFSGGVFMSMLITNIRYIPANSDAASRLPVLPAPLSGVLARLDSPVLDHIVDYDQILILRFRRDFDSMRNHPSRIRIRNEGVNFNEISVLDSAICNNGLIAKDVCSIETVIQLADARNGETHGLRAVVTFNDRRGDRDYCLPFPMREPATHQPHSPSILSRIARALTPETRRRARPLASSPNRYLNDAEVAAVAAGRGLLQSRSSDGYISIDGRRLRQLLDDEEARHQTSSAQNGERESAGIEHHEIITRRTASGGWESEL